jgi:hypothetical protein
MPEECEKPANNKLPVEQPMSRGAMRTSVIRMVCVRMSQRNYKS